MARFVRIGILAALALPFLVFSTASSDALRESKVLVQALGAAIALFGLARGAALPGPPRGPFARFFLFGLSAALALALLSAIANANVVDPLTAAAVLSPMALLVLGASAAGAAVAPAALATLMAAGAFTGALAALQRWAGLFRMPLDVPEPRFLAAGLIGNAGDVGMALVLPALLLFARFARSATPGATRTRVLSALGLLSALLGLIATEAIGPALAFGAGALLYVALDFPKRRFALFAVLAVGVLAGTTGVGQRAFVKLKQLRMGDVATATTQRDIGLYAAREMVRARPILGAGPGAFSNRFVPARLAAEERTGRRLVHWSGSAHFDNAHSDPVTLAAEVGVPAACTACLASAALLVGLFGRRREAPPTGIPPADVLLAALLGVAFLALGDFPLRIAVASGPAAYLAGLSFRLLTVGEDRAASRGGRVALRACALLLVALAAARSLATLRQADGETLLRDAASAPAEAASERAELLSAADARLANAVALRPCGATAVLALGSVQALRGERERAYALYARSVSLEERAESDLNLGRAAAALGRADEAQALFARTVWIQPRLLDALPAEERERAAAAVRKSEEGLGHGGSVPPFPR